MSLMSALADHQPMRACSEAIQTLSDLLALGLCNIRLATKAHLVLKTVDLKVMICLRGRGLQSYLICNQIANILAVNTL